VIQGWQKHFIALFSHYVFMRQLWSSWLSAQSTEKFWWHYTFQVCPCKVCCWNLASLRVHLLAIYISVSQAQINSVCSQMSNTAHKLCHQEQTCTESKSSWPTRCGIRCMDIYTTPTCRITWYVLSIHGRSKSYNTLGIQMHVQTKHSPEVWSRHSITWPPQEVRCAWQPSHHTQWKALQSQVATQSVHNTNPC